MTVCAADLTTREVNVPAQFPLSGSGQVVCTSIGGAALAGNVQLVYTGQSSYLLIPARVENGAKLISLYDSEKGIIFRNNTMALPIYQDSARVASMVLATDSMVANSEGFFGRITGAELDIPTGTTVHQGSNFSADIAIFLRDLPQGIAYRVETGKANQAADLINTGLSQAGLSAQEVPLAVEVYGTNPQSRDSVEFVVVTIGVDAGWEQKTGMSNATCYMCNNGSAVQQSYRVLKAGSDKLIYQLVSPGPGVFALAVTGGKMDRSLTDIPPDLLEILLLGGLLMMLTSLLIVMIQRVIRRKQQK